MSDRRVVEAPVPADAVSIYMSPADVVFRVPADVVDRVIEPAFIDPANKFVVEAVPNEEYVEDE